MSKASPSRVSASGDAGGCGDWPSIDVGKRPRDSRSRTSRSRWAAGSWEMARRHAAGSVSPGARAAMISAFSRLERRGTRRARAMDRKARRGHAFRHSVMVGMRLPLRNNRGRICPAARFGKGRDSGCRCRRGFSLQILPLCRQSVTFSSWSGGSIMAISETHNAASSVAFGGTMGTLSGVSAQHGAKCRRFWRCWWV